MDEGVDCVDCCVFPTYFCFCVGSRSSTFENGFMGFRERGVDPNIIHSCLNSKRSSRGRMSDKHFSAFAFVVDVLRANGSYRDLFIEEARPEGNGVATVIGFITLLARIRDDESVNRLVANFYEKNPREVEYILVNTAFNLPDGFLDGMMEDMDDGVSEGKIDEGEYLDTVNALKILYEVREERWRYPNRRRPSVS